MTGSESCRMVPVKYKPKFTADFVIDGHSHIQSGATAPLPLIWNRISNVQVNRTIIDTIAPLFIKGCNVQKKKTEEIADILAGELAATYDDSKLLKDKPYKDGMMAQQNKGIFSSSIIMPMDMDFAHIAGFPPESSTIYHEGTFEKWITTGTEGMYAGAATPTATKITVNGVYYYERKDALSPENKGDLVDVSHEKPEKGWLYQNYKKQITSTIESVKKNPWCLIPMFHYDPRRWCKASGEKVDEDNWKSGPWDFPFKYITTIKKTGLFSGFKMYPPLGYKPLDSRLPNLEKFYARCEDEGIPILPIVRQVE